MPGEKSGLLRILVDIERQVNRIASSDDLDLFAFVSLVVKKQFNHKGHGGHRLR